ncbi:hypothetical protein Tco_0509760 [Tanacetum coccineum]
MVDRTLPLNGPVHMITAGERVGRNPTHRLAVRHLADHSSSDSSAEASSDFHSDAPSDSSSRHSLSDHSSPDLPSTYTGPSRKRRRSPMTYVPALSLCVVDHREIVMRDEAIVESSDEPPLEQDSAPADFRQRLTRTGVRGPVEVRVERVTHPVMPEDIPEPAQEGAVEVTYETLGDLVQRFHDHTQAIPVHRIQTIEGVQREQGHRMVGVESAVIALTKRIAELERDNVRLRGTMSVESQRVDRLQRGMSRMQRELRQMRRLRFYDRVRVGRLEAKMPNTRSGASMTRAEFEELVNRRKARTEEMEMEELRGKWRKWTMERTNMEKKKWKMKWDSWHENMGGTLLCVVQAVFATMEKCSLSVIVLRSYQVKYATDIEDNALPLMFIGRFTDNLQGNVIAANPARLQAAIALLTIDGQEGQGYAARCVRIRGGWKVTTDNRGQQPATASV